MPKHGHRQAHLRPVMNGGAGRKARPEQMRIDPLAEGLTRPSANQAVERVVAKRPAVSAEPEPAGRLGVTEQWAVMVDIAIDARRAPIGQDGEVRSAFFGLLGGDLDAPGRPVLD